MANDNPFAEPDDSDRTIIRPAPGGRPAAPAAPPPGAARPAQPPPNFPPSAPPQSPFPPASAAPPQSFAPPPSFAPQPSYSSEPVNRAAFSVGTSPLGIAAAPLLQLLARLGNTATPPDSGDLRERAVAEMRRFEQAARDGGVPMEQLRPAHYALCASLDDVVLNTPWGSNGVWASRSLVSTFHQEVRSGDRFFDLLGQMRQNPGTMLPVLELMYVCLSLGFMGRHRLSQRGVAEIDRLREETYAVIARQRGAMEPGLSPRWEGVKAPYRPSRARLPVWVAAVAGLAIVAGLFVWSARDLAEGSDGLFAQALAMPPGHMPAIQRASAVVPPRAPPPVPGETTAVDRLRTFLKPEIDQGLVSVLGTDATPIVRIRNQGLFASGSATLNERFAPLLDRIGKALAAEKGSVNVIGYTDNQPIRTVKFPSNFQLSAARAAAATAALAQSMGGTERLHAEGRADADPIAPNTTPDGREQNRRIEVVLHRQS
jgi:type VI secretion system protein ImpK